MAVAQQQPDSGSVLQQLRLPPRDPAVNQPRVRIDPPATPGAAADTPPFPVSGFRVTGSTVFPESELVALLGPPGSLTLSQIQQRAARLTQFYVDRGYPVARALVPAQDVQDGVVEIRMVEGRYGKIDIRNATELSESRIRSVLSDVAEGRIVHGPTLERAVLQLSDLSGIEPKATLEPGESAGSTDLVLEIGAGKERDVSVSLDNAGSRFTGRHRISVAGGWNSPTDRGDRLTASAVTSGRLLLSMRLAYDAPVGSSGLRAGAFASRTTYRLGETFSALDASGTVDSLGLLATLPLLRSSAANVRATAGLEERKLEDRVGAAGTVANKAASVAQLGLSGDLRDGLLAGGLTALQGQWTFGRLRLETAALAASDAATLETQGSYSKFVATLNRLQGLSSTMRLGVLYTVQRAGKNLDSSEKFALGGLTGVRAYPPGEAAGDDAELLQLELRHQGAAVGPGQLSPLAFYDRGRSRLIHNGFGGARNVRELAGYGVGAEWMAGGSYFLRAWLAFKATSDPATADTDSKSRLWLQAGAVF